MKLSITGGKSFDIKEGVTIYETLKANGVFLVSPCGGKGTCGKCQVKVASGGAVIKSYGKLGQKERDDGIVLACLTTANADLQIEIPEHSKLVLGGKIAVSTFKDTAAYLKSYDTGFDPLAKRVSLTLPPPSIQDNIGDLERLSRSLGDIGITTMRYSHEFVSTLMETLREGGFNADIAYSKTSDTSFDAISVYPPGKSLRRFGLAIDIGTTTVVVYLVDLADGTVIDIGSTYNSQTKYGDDVITRIIHATEGGGLADLRDTVVGDINTIVDFFITKHNIKRHDIEAAVISGNTTMAHIFWGLNPASIREEPYIPTVNYYPLWDGSQAKLAINPQAALYTTPSIASYVGGDIVSGILASKMHRSSGISLFMDIGTNAEVAIGNDEWIMTAACSAGPCFEGGGIKFGMRATQGAIESISIDPNTLTPSISVIGGEVPAGICGSGMIDAVVELYKTGIINQKGVFNPAKTPLVREGEDGLEFLIYKADNPQRDIVLTTVDMENLIRAKAAIFAGVSLLLREAGLTLDVLEKVYVAGGFGNSLNVEKAIMFGMIPDLPSEKYVFLGNTSIIGAYLTLMSDSLRTELESIASKMTYIELSVVGDYMDEYMSAMFIPHTDFTKFPSVAAALGM
ncbi:MAG: ASKHA domain-containing protein [Nitrospirota bacterium]